jgi:serine/threonine protein phosphatase PrpC
MELEILTLSKIGGRSRNEDACGVWSNHDACFLVLSDGAGGHGGGDVASKLVVKHALSWFRATPACTGPAVEAALRAANSAIVDEQRREQRLQDMRATAVVLVINTARAEATWGHLGDSRLYCFRNYHIVAQTRDHSVVQSMVDAGYLPAQDLRSAPDRSKLLAALGDAEHFEPSIEPGTLPLFDGDAFLLCTDGFWEYVQEDEMETALIASTSAEEWLRALESSVLGRGRPGQDNYSAIAVWCTDPRENTRPPVSAG